MRSSRRRNSVMILKCLDNSAKRGEVVVAGGQRVNRFFVSMVRQLGYQSIEVPQNRLAVPRQSINSIVYIR